MCGIAGVLKRQGLVPDGALEGQLRALDHRGPDSWGVFARANGAVGQTRLAVVDLVTGDPPIATPDGTIGVALNGEIYNFGDLRKGLLEDGHTLRTSGDTEVLAHLAEGLEPADIARSLDGMFAFAIWDTRKRRLILGRDRFGKKPLYWWHGDNQFVFGSEIKSLLAHPAVPSSLDEDVLGAYLGFGYVPSPRTFFEGIRSVPPGHVMVVDEDLHVTTEAYWRLPLPGASPATRLDVSFDEAARLVRGELHEAIARRLVADVPLGAFLSGGIDSSAVVALMAQQVSSPVRTFTIGFDDTDGFDERGFARLVADRYGTEHTEFVVAPHAIGLVEELVWHHDQPFGDSSAVPTYLLSKLTRQHVTVALCGDGGDEVFGGYERFIAARIAPAYARLPRQARTVAEWGLGRLPSGAGGRARRFARVAGAGMPEALRQWISYTPDDVVDSLAPGTAAWARASYGATWNATAGAAHLDRILALNIETYLLDDLLPKVDRTSMAHALEVRAPLLDHHLAELAFRLPPSYRLRGLQTKRVLRAAVASDLPEEILRRGKRGFGVPLARWFRDDLRGMVASTLGSPEAAIKRYLDAVVVDRVIAEHNAGAVDRGHELWTLLTLEMFLRRHSW